MLSDQDFQQQLLGALVNAAREQPGGKLDIHDQAGAIIATVHAHQLPKRPKDMPRHLRPKHPLSKRQRVAAKHARAPSPS